MKHVDTLKFCLVFVFSLIFISVTVNAQNTYVVKDTSDATNIAVGTMTLRGALSLANANISPTPDTILFDIPDAEFPFIFKPRGVFFITDPVAIQGYSQGNLNTGTHTDPTKIATQGPIGQRSIQIVLDGSAQPSGSRSLFRLNNAQSQNISISGIVFNNIDRISGRAIEYTNTAAITNPIHIWGCYFGTDVTGLSAVPSSDITGTGGTGTHSNIVFTNATVNSPVYIGTNGDGVNDTNEGNLISNAYYGIDLTVAVGSTQSVHIAGNYLGTNANCAATTDVLDLRIAMIPVSAVYVRNGGNVIVGVDNALTAADTLKRNVICDALSGIQIAANSAAMPVIIAGNYIGVAKDGTTPIPNRKDYTATSTSPSGATGGNGIQLNVPNTNNVRIGSDANSPADSIERNIISGNQAWGISLAGNNHVVAGNYIGTDKTGLVAVPNGSSGISGNDDRNTGFIIGVSPTSALQYPQFERNVISGNGAHGIAIKGDNHIIAGNYIGVGSDGVTKIGNGQYIAQPGIQIASVTAAPKKNRFIRIGTTGGTRATAERNIISNNSLHGITFNQASYATIAGNYIGLDQNQNPAANNGCGIWMIQSDSSVIGAPSTVYAPELANIIANNKESGVALSNGGGAGTPYGPSQRIRISQNSFYKNTIISIDLAHYPIAGSRDQKITVNDGITNSADDNNGTDYPIFTAYTLNGSNISVQGFVGKCGTDSATAGTTLTGPLTLEIYAEDDNGYTQKPTSAECKVVGTAHGEGKTYLGFVSFTSSNPGTFSGTFTPVVSDPTLYIGKKLTGITIDGDGNTSEFGTYAFKVIPLPLKLESFTGVARKEGNLLGWRTASEVHLDHFEIEYSDNSTDFTKIGTTTATGAGTYSYMHANVFGNAWYRLKCVDVDGKFAYSNVINLQAGNSSNGFVIRAASFNTSTSAIELSVSADAPHNLALVMYDMTGKCCLKQSLAITGNGVYEINVPSNLSTGIYILKIVDDNGATNIFRVVR